MLRLIQYLVFSNVVISLGAASFLLFGFMALDKSPNYYAITFIFFSTLLMYNLQRVHKLQYQTLNLNNPRHLWFSKFKKRIQFVIVLSGLILAMLLPFFDYKVLIGLAGLGVISFFYSFPNKFVILRDVPGLKIFLIAAVWSITIMIFTVDDFISKKDWLLLIYNLSFMLAITIPFDIRDLDFDEDHHKTIPQLIGAGPSRVLSAFLMLSAFYILTLLLGNFSIFLSLVYGIFTLLCLFSTPNRKELYFSGIMDFTLVLAAVFLALYLKVYFLQF